METISFKNPYSFVGTLTNASDDEVIATVVADGVDELFPKLNIVFSKAPPLILTDGLRAPGENSDLLAQGSNLTEKTKALLRRQEKNPNAEIGPITINCDLAVINFFRNIIVQSLRPVFEKVKTNSVRHVDQLLRSIKGEEREKILSSIVQATESAISNPQAISFLLETIRHKDWEPLFEHAHQTAIVAKVLCAKDHDAREEMSEADEENLCKAALFRDIAIMVKPALYKNDTARHPLRSAQMMAEMGLPADACEIAKLHHRLEDDSGKPILRSKSITPTLSQRLLTLADFFVETLSAEKGLNKDIETIKAMTMMAYEGYLDSRAVKVLTELYFTKKLALFLDKAYRLAGFCLYPYETDAILWNILGDKVPYKFICRYEKCIHLGTQTTLISQEIPIGDKNNPVSKIKKGEYLNCRFLTGKLALVHKEIAKLK